MHGSLQDQKSKAYLLGSPPLFKTNSLSSSFSNIPQSPMLSMNNRIYSNPGLELEKLALRRELNETRHELVEEHSKYEATRKERDLVLQNFRKLQETMLTIKSILQQNMGKSASPEVQQATLDAVVSQITATNSCPEDLLEIINAQLRKCDLADLTLEQITTDPEYDEAEAGEMATPQPRVPQE
ncbi:hypothetical protein Ciccas_001789 [Cichlidogyrus casuarinus]|uniref:Uncharacterized protein n=1 Tax=Cichlidogyrus casuarinus TaxID=1844966 RepID=A0ABD2QJ13_9PLAT